MSEKDATLDATAVTGAPESATNGSADLGTIKQMYAPIDEVVEQANVTAYMRQKGFSTYDDLYNWSVNNAEEFWSDHANELEWYQPWAKVLDESNAPFYKWFVGAKCNIVHNAMDRHVKGWRRNKIALIWEGEDGTVRSYSYHRMSQIISQYANILKSMGVKKGDIVTIYLPRIPELVMFMMACAKIGAAHSVVYGGFSVEALADRLSDAKSKVLVTADGGFMRNKIVPLKEIANEAMARTPTLQASIVVRRTGADVPMEVGRDLWLDDLLSLPIASVYCETEQMDAEDPLFILYTSGTTGRPKGVVHTHGGYMVGIYTTMKYVFDLKEQDRWWCAADPGWITGHSYITYSPYINGATSFMYEGAPNFPYPDRWWRMIERYGISHLYTAPTAIRGLMRFGEAWPERHDLSSLRMLGSVGEPINPEAWRWYYKVIGKERCPIMDTWWQTETGHFMITPTPVVPLKPGSATRPFLGVKIDVVHEDTGEPCAPNEDGALVIQRPWPGMLRTILNDPDRYRTTYWEKVPGGVYTVGDSARIDDDGYVWVIGRIDDVIKVSGYRLGTAEVESALVSHPKVAEAAAIGLPHELKGNAIHTFVILKDGVEATPQLSDELRAHVGHEIGPIARPESVEFVASLPKTRSGKIMRRVLKAQALGQDVGDVSTLEN